MPHVTNSPEEFSLAHWQRYLQRYVDAFMDESGCDTTAFASQTGKLCGAREKHDTAGTQLLSTLRCFGEEQKISPFVICSPHPDDECLVGGLPMRMLREDGIPVINLALTLGSAAAHKSRRREELHNACTRAGFELVLAGGEGGLDSLSEEYLNRGSSRWQHKVALLVERFVAYAPGCILLPHSHDRHPTHIGTHYLALDAVCQYTKSEKKTVALIESEFWHPMSSPNLLVHLSSKDLAQLLYALSCHVGELQRNPYHLWLPARCMDTMRRGWELICGSDAPFPAQTPFAELYRLSLMRSGVKEEKVSKSSVLTTPGP